jgi:hypothetical protein
MKKTDSKSQSSPVPRLNSLLHRLQKAPGQKDESYLDQLMIFLEDPPDDIRNRWIKGAEMCAAWGIHCSDTSVWRLYRSYALEWRSRLALEASLGEGEKTEVVEERAAKMLALRLCEIVGDPQAPHDSLINLALLDIRKKALEFARQKHADSQLTLFELAMRELETQVFGNWDAQFAFDRLKDALKKKKAPTLSPLLMASNPDVAFKIVSESYSPDSPYSPGSLGAPPPS